MSENLSLFLKDHYYGNTLFQWLTAIGVSFFTLSLSLFLRRWMMKYTYEIPSFRNNYKQLFCLLFTQTKFFFLFLLSLSIGISLLALPENIKKYWMIILGVGLILQIGLWGNALINFYLKNYRENHLSDNAANVTTFSFLGFLFKLVFFTLLLLFVFNNLGINVTTALTGLGIGGIAVALAAQNVLSDLFASLSIIFDKPFVLRDYIVVGNYEGQVEDIGLKTTRIRSLSGEQIVFSNADLLKSQIRNYERMEERRVVFNLKVAYPCDLEKLRKIPEKIKEIVESQPQSRFDHAHLKELGNGCVTFEIVYFLKDSKYLFFTGVQQDINFRILGFFEESGIALYQEGLKVISPPFIPANIPQAE